MNGCDFESMAPLIALAFFFGGFLGFMLFALIRANGGDYGDNADGSSG